MRYIHHVSSVSSHRARISFTMRSVILFLATLVGCASAAQLGGSVSLSICNPGFSAPGQVDAITYYRDPTENKAKLSYRFCRSTKEVLSFVRNGFIRLSVMPNGAETSRSVVDFVPICNGSGVSPYGDTSAAQCDAQIAVTDARERGTDKHSVCISGSVLTSLSFMSNVVDGESLVEVSAQVVRARGLQQPLVYLCERE
jgi:hypothetical protein